jgi:Mitochondrial ribosomal protein L51 / S25 / CI-B8 domain
LPAYHCNGSKHPCASCRDFLQKILPSFKEHNPQLDIAAQVKRGQHPHLTAEYGAMASQQLVSIGRSVVRHRLL